MADAAALIPLCASDRLAEGGDGFRFEALAGGEPVGAFVVRFDGQVRGYLNRCAHVAMELDWQRGRFFDDDGLLLICATHGAAYDPADGSCVGGPCAGRGGLRRLHVVEQAGIVYWRPDADLRPRDDARAG